MKTRILLLTTAVALVIGAVAFAGTETEKNSPETELDRLQKKISALELRVKTLEKRLEASTALTYPPQVQLPATPPAQSPAVAGSLQDYFRQPVPSSDGNTQRPKIWGEGEINGWKYYLIPCAAGTGGSPQAAPLKVVSPN